MRQMSDPLSFSTDPAPAFAGPAPAPRVLLRGERQRSRGRWRYEARLPGGLGVALAGAVILAAFAVGAVRGGHYATFVKAEGGIGDFFARELGFGVKVVTISGIARLDEKEVLDIAGITPNASIPFFDVDGARARLERAPLVASVGVRKFYPNRVVIDVTERGPVALWQRDGEVSIVAEDGAALDELKDARLNNLPFVVGKGANKRLKEYLAILDAAEELGPRIEAGVFVSERRWNLRMKTGLDVKLPETDPAAAMATLLKLERESRILSKDILYLDLREPRRVFARLSAAALDAWALKFPVKKKGEKP
jgi:cell division protein FtsQ